MQHFTADTKNIRKTIHIFISPNEGRQDTQNKKDRMTYRPKN